MNRIDRLIDIPVTDPESVRQRKLLNALLALLALTSVVQEIVLLAILVFDLPLHPPLAVPQFRLMAHVGTLVAVILCGVLFVINRYASARTARILFVVLLAVSVFTNTPDDWTLATLTYALSIPIFIASFLLGPKSSFVVTFLASVVTSAVALYMGLDIYVTPISNFLAISMLAWFTARTLKHALANLRVLIRELDQRVVERTQELAEALGKNQAILDSTADGVIVFDNDGRAVVANPAVTRLLGRQPDDIVGQTIEEIMPEDVSQEDREALVGYLRDPRITHPVKIPWGKKTLSISLAPVRDHQARVTGTVTVFRDFTREAEVDRMKSTFVSIASHELRTPLNAIMGYAEIMQDVSSDPLSSRQREMVERIIANTERLLSLANNLLDQAQMEAGRLDLETTTFAAEELVESVCGVMDVMARARGLRLTRRIDDDVPATLVGDQQRLHQILMNLVSNATKFTEEGGVHVRIYRPDAGHWAIEVSDTGCGISAEAQAVIFEPFRRADDLTTRRARGAGLGLSIVRQLVTLMGGEIVLHSEVERGSTFTIVLPLDGGEALETIEV